MDSPVKIGADLERFDRREGVREEARRVRARQNVTPIGEARFRGSKLKWVMIIYVVILSAASVFGQASLSEAQYKNDKLSKSITKLEQENKMLTARLESGVKLDEIAETAKSEYKMIKPERSQIEYIDLSEEEAAEPLRRKTVLDTIWEFFTVDS